VFVVSDHGFKGIKRQIRPNAAFRAQGWLTATGDTITSADVQIIPEGGSAMIYFPSPDKKAELLPRVRELVASLEGVDRVIGPDEFAALGLPAPGRNDQMADLVAFAKPDHAFAANPDGEAVVDAPDGLRGNHGFAASDPDMDAVFIAWGYGIKPGARLERIANVDVAPTTAALLGLDLGAVDGHVLSEVLE
jgi:predicted AlkP superfamily pyrophosphatase or phosphodiesterase